MADRLVRIVDRYMPKVADENRAYVMPYPGKVKDHATEGVGAAKAHPPPRQQKPATNNRPPWSSQCLRGSR